MHIIPFQLKIYINISRHVSAHIHMCRERMLYLQSCHRLNLERDTVSALPDPQVLPQKSLANSSLLGKRFLSSHGTTLCLGTNLPSPSLPGLSNFMSCSLMTKVLPTCTLLKIVSSPSLESSSESMEPPQRTVHSSTEHLTLTWATVIVFLRSVLVSGVAFYNPFSTQQQCDILKT